ncbi:DUF4870 domain-containing protein [Nocardioides sambongensis]|uniref:DUF4870 domain-containing protein n=1 Tax=Nocardioides sambongensis TaxID=2589074 RepID=UPI0011293537|nr:DUF4870 domain-containing protein [Nocardioides sambongensis]
MPADPTSDARPRRRPATGALAWGSGLAIFLFVPFFAPTIALTAIGLLMAAVGRRQRDKNEVAAENGRNAANWGLTLVVVSLGLVAMSYGGGLFPLGLILSLLGGVAVAHIVVCVMGVLRAGDRRAFRPPAIPFYN